MPGKNETPWDPFDLTTLNEDGNRVPKDPKAKFLRQSHLGSGDICLQRMGYDMSPWIERGTGEARIVGTAYHAGLEVLYTARQNGERASLTDVVNGALESFQDPTEDGTPFTGWVTSEEQAWDRIVLMLGAYHEHGQWPDEYRVLGVEQEWFLPLRPGMPPWILKGTIDLILEGPHGLVLDDHKTAGRAWPKGKESPHKNVQVPLYWNAVRETLGRQPYAFTFSVTTYKGVFERRWVNVTQAQIDAVLRKADAITRIVDHVPLDLLPTNPSSNLCSPLYCDHWERCPAGAIAAQVA